MDKQDFAVTVRETWEGIERAIEELALDGVEAYPDGSGLRLEFDDGSFFALQRDDENMHIDLLRGEERAPCYWDGVEEEWYVRLEEQPLRTVLSRLLAEKLSRPVTLPDLT